MATTSLVTDQILTQQPHQESQRPQARQWRKVDDFFRARYAVDSGEQKRLFGEQGHAIVGLRKQAKRVLAASEAHLERALYQGFFAIQEQ